MDTLIIPDLCNYIYYQYVHKTYVILRGCHEIMSVFQIEIFIERSTGN